MKALTLTQPWASLIAIGAKAIETRGWSTTYRGPLAIHAAQGLRSVGGKRAFWKLEQSEPFYSTLRQAGLPDYARFSQGYPFGAIVATCRLVDSVPLTEANGKAYRWNEPTRSWVLVPELEASFGDYTYGRWGFLLSGVRALSKPIQARGALGLWDWQVPHSLELHP